MKAIYADAVRPAPDPATRQVRSVMGTPVVCVGADVPLAEALSVMVGGGLRHLAVVDGYGRCLGILSDRAVAAVWAAGPASLSRRTAAQTLGTAVAMVDPDASIQQAARRMLAAGTDAVAVVGPRGAVVGIVTGSDLIRLLAG